jgi:glycyl-tRNA synthetase
MTGSFEKVLDLAERRGFFWQSAKDLYADSPAGFWVYGPLGTRMKNKIIELWRRAVLKEGALEIETPVMLPIKVFEASGHLEHFFDRLVECKRCHSRFRVDKLIEESTNTKENLEGMSDSQLAELLKNVKCPKCGSINWTDVKHFNLMFTFPVGADATAPNAALRPETTQGSVIEFKRAYTISRGRLPFILAQVGKVFRNEIAPRRALIRMREFQQLELHVFFDPEDVNSYREKLEGLYDYKLRFHTPKDRITGGITEMTVKEALESGYTVNPLITYWLVFYQRFFNEILGFPLERLRYRELLEGEKAHYALVHWDLEAYTEDLGWTELVNNAYRTDYDLSGHQRVSGVKLEVDSDGKKVLPHLYEPSVGVDRVVYHVLAYSYREDEERVWLSIPRKIAPIEVAVFPLLKKDDMVRKAKEVARNLMEEGFYVFYDDSGSIGRRYRRMDEVGTPACVTIDHETLVNDTVTLRDRDTMKQIRISLRDLPVKLRRFLDGENLESLEK